MFRGGRIVASATFSVLWLSSGSSGKCTAAAAQQVEFWREKLSLAVLFRKPVSNSQI